MVYWLDYDISGGVFLLVMAYLTTNGSLSENVLNVKIGHFLFPRREEYGLESSDKTGTTAY